MKFSKIFAQAIAEKKCVEITYDDGISRIIEPHTYGISNAGNLIVSAFRVKKVGFDESPDWRIYLCDKIARASILESSFTTRSGYNSNPRNFITVHCKV